MSSFEMRYTEDDFEAVVRRREGDSAIDIEARHPGVIAMANILIDFYRAQGGVNYVTLEMVDEKTRERFEIVIQRAGGLTPAQKLGIAEQRIRELEARVLK